MILTRRQKTLRQIEEQRRVQRRRLFLLTSRGLALTAVLADIIRAYTTGLSRVRVCSCQRLTFVVC